MVEYRYSLNLQVQGQTLDDLVRTMDEIKKHIESGSGMAHDKNENRRYALSIDDEKMTQEK